MPMPHTHTHQDFLHLCGLLVLAIDVKSCIFPRSAGAVSPIQPNPATTCTNACDVQKLNTSTWDPQVSPAPKALKLWMDGNARQEYFFGDEHKLCARSACSWFSRPLIDTYWWHTYIYIWIEHYRLVIWLFFLLFLQTKMHYQEDSEIHGENMIFRVKTVSRSLC